MNILNQENTGMQNIEWFTKCHGYRELDGIDGEPVEFEWTISQDAQHSSCFVQRTMTENRIQPEQFEDRIIFMSMYNDIDWEKS